VRSGVCLSIKTTANEALRQCGTTFTLEPQPLPGISCSYSAVSDSFLRSYCSGGHFMFPYAPTDGGAHFDAVARAAARTTPTGYPNGAGLAAASAATAVAVGSMPGSPLIRTADHGARWTVVQAAPASSGQWTLIGFTTPDVGYALWQRRGLSYRDSTAELWCTTGGGATWTRVTGLS
jgi:hypothetical protein